MIRISTALSTLAALTLSAALSAHPGHNDQPHLHTGEILVALALIGLGTWLSLGKRSSRRRWAGLGLAAGGMMLGCFN